MMHRDAYVQVLSKKQFTAINTKDVFSKSIAGDTRLGMNGEPVQICSDLTEAAVGWWERVQLLFQVRSGQAWEV